MSLQLDALPTRPFEGSKGARYLPMKKGTQHARIVFQRWTMMRARTARRPPRSRPLGTSASRRRPSRRQPNPLWLTQRLRVQATGVVLGAGVGAMMGLFFGILEARTRRCPWGLGGRAIPAAPTGAPGPRRLACARRQGAVVHEVVRRHHGALLGLRLPFREGARQARRHQREPLGLRHGGSPRGQAGPPGGVSRVRRLRGVFRGRGRAHAPVAPLR